MLTQLLSNVSCDESDVADYVLPDNAQTKNSQFSKMSSYTKLKKK